MLIKLVWVLAIYFLIAGVFRIVHLIRAHAMRTFATRLGSEHIGPGAPPNWLWNPSHFHTPSPLPSWISHLGPSGQRIRQVWNVIKGKCRWRTCADLRLRYWRGQRRSSLHCHNVPNRTKPLRNCHVEGPRFSDSRMVSPSRFVVPLVLLDHGYKASRNTSERHESRSTCLILQPSTLYPRYCLVYRTNLQLPGRKIMHLTQK